MRGRHRPPSKAARSFARAASAVASMALSIGTLGIGAGLAHAEETSATAAGSGEFSNVRVTVSDTRNLISQVVKITWSGAKPTEPVYGNFDRNYMQIMQCWGDDASGPDRTQCQFGALSGDTRGGSWVASRQVTYTDTFTDPAETIVRPAGSREYLNVPFKSVTGKVVTTGLNEFYDGYSTNEIPFARTRADGTGQEYFEVQSAREAPGLGCGEALKAQDGSVHGRNCWLVVVPRSNIEMDGSPRDLGEHLDSSPLSASNWAKRIVVPLQFQTLSANCPIGKAERPTVGQEVVAEAISRWQPTLCERTPAIYGYSQVGDATARRQLLTDKPGMAFVSNELGADQIPAAGPAVYGPIALSGLVVAFNIERQSSISAPASVQAHNGERIAELKLTPRLVAKLLTLSYRTAALSVGTVSDKNPIDLTRDPEFLALNPEFKTLFFSGIPDMIVPIGLADTTSQVWTWLRSDSEADAFLAGKADPWGMTINPNYKNLDIPRDDFPKRDPRCRQYDDHPELCIFDARPYAQDLHEAARSASRGDSLGRGVWDPTATPPAYKKGPPQLSGTRALLALTDAATAARYSLPTASIRNAAGEFVTASTASLDAAASTITSYSLTRTPQPDFTAKVQGSYPLATVSYAATIPRALDSAARTDYSNFLTYALGDGQRPGLEIGDLPHGYAPLQPAMISATTKMIAEITHPTLKAVIAAQHSRQGSSTPDSPVSGGPPTSILGSGSAPSVGTKSVIPVTPTATSETPLIASGRRAVIASTIIPGSHLGLARYAISGAFALGAAAVVAGPSLQFLARRRAGATTT